MDLVAVDDADTPADGGPASAGDGAASAGGAAGRRAHGATLERVAERAGMSAERAREHYGTVEDCLLDSYEEAAARLLEACGRALDRGGRWQERLHAAAAAGIAELAEWPRLARFYAVEAERMGFASLHERRAATHERLAELVARQAVGDGSGDELPGLRFEFMSSAVEHVVTARLESGDCDPERLPDLVEQLISVFEPMHASPAG